MSRERFFTPYVSFAPGIITPMKRNEKASFSNAIPIVLVAISIFSVLCQVGICQPGQPVDPGSYGMTSGRLASIVGAVAGLIGVVIGGLALARPSSRFSTDSGQVGALIALVAGMIGIILGGWVVSTSGGRIGV